MCVVLCALPFPAAVKRKIMQNCLVSVVQNADFLTQVFKHWEVFFELEVNMWGKKIGQGKKF